MYIIYIYIHTYAPNSHITSYRCGKQQATAAFSFSEVTHRFSSFFQVPSRPVEKNWLNHQNFIGFIFGNAINNDPKWSQWSHLPQGLFIVWFAVLVQLGLFENGVYKNPVSKWCFETSHFGVPHFRTKPVFSSATGFNVRKIFVNWDHQDLGFSMRKQFFNIPLVPHRANSHQLLISINFVPGRTGSTTLKNAGISRQFFSLKLSHKIHLGKS